MPDSPELKYAPAEGIKKDELRSDTEKKLGSSSENILKSADRVETAAKSGFIKNVLDRRGDEVVGVLDPKDGKIRTGDEAKAVVGGKEVTLREQVAESTERLREMGINAEEWRNNNYAESAVFEQKVVDKATEYGRAHPDRSNDENYFDALGNVHDQAVAAGEVYGSIAEQADKFQEISQDDKEKAAYDLSERIKQHGSDGRFKTPDERQKLVDEKVFSAQEMSAIEHANLVIGEGLNPKTNADRFNNPALSEQQRNQEWDKAVYETAAGLLEDKQLESLLALGQKDVAKDIYNKANDVYNLRTGRDPSINANGGVGDKPYGPELPADPGINASGGVGDEQYGPKDPSINESGGVGDKPYGPENPTDGLNKFGGVGDKPYGPELPEYGPKHPRQAELDEAHTKTAEAREAYLKAEKAARSNRGNLWTNFLRITRLGGKGRESLDQAVDRTRVDYEQAAKNEAISSALITVNKPEGAASPDAQEKYQDNVAAEAMRLWVAEKGEFKSREAELAAKNWFQKLYRNGKVRTAVSVGLLVGAGVSGATGNVPLSAAFLVARTGLSAIATEQGLNSLQTVASKLKGERQNLSDEEIKGLSIEEIQKRKAAFEEVNAREGRNKPKDVSMAERLSTQEMVLLLTELKNTLKEQNITGSEDDKTAAVLEAVLKKDQSHSEQDKSLRWNRRAAIGRAAVATTTAVLLNWGGLSHLGGGENIAHAAELADKTVEIAAQPGPDGTNIDGTGMNHLLRAYFGQDLNLESPNLISDPTSHLKELSNLQNNPNYDNLMADFNDQVRQMNPGRVLDNGGVVGTEPLKAPDMAELMAKWGFKNFAETGGVGVVDNTPGLGSAADVVANPGLNLGTGTTTEVANNTLNLGSAGQEVVKNNLNLGTGTASETAGNAVNVGAGGASSEVVNSGINVGVGSASEVTNPGVNLGATGVPAEVPSTGVNLGTGSVTGPAENGVNVGTGTPVEVSNSGVNLGAEATSPFVQPANTEVNLGATGTPIPEVPGSNLNLGTGTTTEVPPTNLNLGPTGTATEVTPAEVNLGATPQPPVASEYNLGSDATPPKPKNGFNFGASFTPEAPTTDPNVGTGTPVEVPSTDLNVGAESTPEDLPTPVPVNVGAEAVPGEIPVVPETDLNLGAASTPEGPSSEVPAEIVNVGANGIPEEPTPNSTVNVGAAGVGGTTTNNTNVGAG